MRYVTLIFCGLGLVMVVILVKEICFVVKEEKRYRGRKNSLDDSECICEYPPDGINIMVGSVLEKGWKIQNKGSVTWENRYLKCVHDVPDVFYPDKRVVKIPELKPGEKFMLRVKYYAKEEGFYSSQWKLFDSKNNMLFPEKRGLRCVAKVIASENYSNM